MTILNIIVLSDSIGETGSLVARASVSQFKNQEYELTRYPHIQSLERLEEVLEKLTEFKNTIILYTLVDKKLVLSLKEYARDKKIKSIDLLSPILNSG